MIDELQKSEFLTAKIDRLFKTVFVNPDDTRFMDAILSDALQEKVHVLEFFPTELPIRNKSERIKVLDVLLKTENGKFINAELNTCFDEATKLRNFTFFASFFSQKVKRGKAYDTNDFVHIDLNANLSNSNGLRKVYEVKSEDNETYIPNFKIITSFKEWKIKKTPF